MPEKDTIQTTTAKLMELADVTSEGFVLAITAAYMAGIERGKLVSLKTTPPAA